MFQEFTRFSDELTVQAMDQVIGGGIAASMGVIRGAMALYVLIGLLLILTGKMDLWDGVRRGTRAMAIVLLLSGVDAYNRYVRTTFWDTVPTLIASGVAGGTVSITAAERFDRVNQAASHAVALVDSRLSFYSMRASFSVAVADAAMQVANAISYASWYFCRIATAVMICAGPFILIAFLFDATRGWVMGWLGKLVGLAIATLTTAIITEIMLGGSLFWARRTAANANAGLFEATDALWKLALWFIVMALVMVATPILSFVGGSAAGMSGVATSATLGAASMAAGGGAGATRALARAMRRAGRNKS